MGGDNTDPSFLLRKKKGVICWRTGAYSQTTHFVIRYRDDVTVEMRVVCESKVYEIISMQEEGRKRFLTVVTNLLDNVFYT